MRHYSVVFRACDAVASAHGIGRPYDLAKRELIEICFASLHRALGPVRHQIHVVADRPSDRLSEFFSRYAVKVWLAEPGNEASIRATIRLACGFDDEDWVYFCEDDYLHRPESFEFLDEFLAGRDAYMCGEAGTSFKRRVIGDASRVPLFVSLHDEPRNYRVRKRRPSWIFRSAHTHWRQIADTTFTFMTQARWVRRYRDILERASIGADDSYLSRRLYSGIVLWRRALCLSPVPGLAVHVQDRQITPGFDWKALVESSRESLRKFDSMQRVS
jgi:hypothetical protein